MQAHLGLRPVGEPALRRGPHLDNEEVLPEERLLVFRGQDGRERNRERLEGRLALRGRVGDEYQLQADRWERARTDSGVKQ